MRIPTIAATLFSLALLTATPGLAQELPAECKEALEARSPQAQVDLFTICLDSGRMSNVDRATTYKQRAIAYMHLGQHPRAIQDVNQAIRLKPDDADNFYLRGFAYRATGQYQKAIDDCTQAIQRDSSFAGAFSTRAFAHKALGNTNQARSDAQRALKLDPKIKVPTF